MELPPFHFTVQMWGEAYVRTFLNAALPCLLATGNLPAIDNLADSVFDIYTTAADKAVIEASPAFARLKALLPVAFTLIDHLDLRAHYQAMSWCNRMALEKSDRTGSILMFFQPDTVISDGALAAIQRLFRAGKRAIMVAGLRTRIEEMLPALCTSYQPESAAIALSPRAMFALAWRHLHPISQCCFWDAPNFTSYPSHIYWRAGEEGLVARCAHLHPLAIYPRQRYTSFHETIDYDYVDAAVPDSADYHIVTDSDEILLCEMSRSDYFIGKDRPNAASAGAVAAWMEGGATARHRYFFSHMLLFHQGVTDSPAWMRARQAADVLAAEIDAMGARNLWQLRHTPYFWAVMKNRAMLYMRSGGVIHAADLPLVLPLSLVARMRKVLRILMK